MARRLALFVALASALSCGEDEPPTSLRVAVSSFGLTIPDDLDSVRITARDATADQVFYQSDDFAASRLPITLLLVPGPSAPDDEVDLRVDGLRNGEIVIATALSYRFTLGARETVDLVLFGECLGVTMCPDSEDARACGPAGDCVNARPRRQDTPDLGPTTNDFADDASAIVDGATPGWRLETLPNAPNLKSIWGSGPADIYAVGESRTLVHFNGTNWIKDDLAGLMPLVPQETTFWAVWGTGQNDVYVSGDFHTVLHKTTGGWVNVTADFVGADALFGIGGSNVQDVCIVGRAQTDKRIFYLNSESPGWHGEDLTGLGEQRACHKAGSMFQTGGVQVPVNSSAASPLAHRVSGLDMSTGYFFTTFPDVLPQDLTVSALAVFGSQEWIATDHGIYRAPFPPPATSNQPSTPLLTGNFRALTVISETDIWAGGGETTPTLVHFNGNTWTPTTLTGSSGPVTGVWAASTTQIYAVGNDGSIWVGP